MICDVVIVGGGPAGLAAALHAARAGMQVVVLEPRRAPIDKACGEGLMPGAVCALGRLGITPRGAPLRGIRYVDGLTGVAAPFPAGPGLGIRRTILHGLLHAAALRAGVTILPEQVRDISQDSDWITAAGVRARYLIAADGLHSPVRRLLGLNRPAPRPAFRRWGLRVHIPITPWTDYVEVHWSADSEAYITPVGPECVGVAVLSGKRSSFDQHLLAFPRLLEHLPGKPLEHPQAAGPLRQVAARRVAGRALLVGDAAGYIDALTGEGLGLAFNCAAALVHRISHDNPAEYEKDYRRITRRQRIITSALVTATSHKLVRRRIVPMSARMPRAFQSAVRQLAS